MVVDDFEQHVLRLHMVVRVVGTLQGKVAGFLAGIHVDHWDVPRSAAEFTQRIVRAFAHGAHFAQVRQDDFVFPAMRRKAGNQARMAQ
jgi:hypothetical protein